MRTLPSNWCLSNGRHESFENGACIMETVAWLNEEPWSDRPLCACTVIGAFLRITNDQMNVDQRQILLRLAPKLVGTRTTDDAVRLRRAFIAADWALRIVYPVVLQWLGHADQAEEARALDPIVDARSARTAHKLVRAHSRSACASIAAHVLTGESIYVDVESAAYASAGVVVFAGCPYHLLTDEGVTIAESATRMVERMIEVRS